MTFGLKTIVDLGRGGGIRSSYSNIKLSVLTEILLFFLGKKNLPGFNLNLNLELNLDL